MSNRYLSQYGSRDWDGQAAAHTKDTILLHGLKTPGMWYYGIKLLESLKEGKDEDSLEKPAPLPPKENKEKDQDKG